MTDLYNDIILKDDQRIVTITTLNNQMLLFVVNKYSVLLQDILNKLEENYSTNDCENRPPIYLQNLNNGEPLTKYHAEEYVENFVEYHNLYKDIRLKLTTEKYSVKSLNNTYYLYNITPNVFSMPSFDETYSYYVNLTTLTGKVNKIYCNICDSIENLKQRAEHDTGIPTNQIRLIFCGKQLEDGRTLADYNIQRNSNIRLVMCLRGGMYHETSGKAGNYSPLKDCIFYLD